MKNLSTGTGLALLAGALLGSSIIMRVGTVDRSAYASAPITAATMIATSAATQNPPAPTVVWMGVTTPRAGGSEFVYHRLWSDGRQEVRTVQGYWPDDGPPWPCGYYPEFVPSGCPFNWRELPPPPSGNGFACRADLDGDRVIDGSDLGIILANWGPQPPCEPDATYPCMTIKGGNLLK
jgi:hypothetical protein